MTESARVDLGPNRSALYSLEAEEAVLGCVLINPDAYFEVAPFLRPDDFYLHKHRWIWDVFIHLHDQRMPVDFITVSQELDGRRLLDEVGGGAYLTHLLNTVPTSLHAEAYGRIVQRDALRRRLLEAATSVAKLAYAEERDINEVVNEAEAAVFAVSEQRQTKELIPLREVISSYYDQIKLLSERKGEVLGVPTGFVDLDRILGGLQKSDLLIIAGRPGSGKTGFMLSVAKNAAQIHKKHVAVFSLEMSNEQLAQRLMAQETGIDSQRLRLGDVHDDEWPLFVEAASALSDAPLFLDDTPTADAPAAAGQMPPPRPGIRPGPGGRGLSPVDAGRKPERKPRAGGRRYFPRPQGAGARAQGARAGRGAALARRGAAAGKAPDFVGFARVGLA